MANVDVNPAATAPPPARLTPDRELVQRLLASGGEDLKKCIQCATCSAVCELSQERAPFPRKEMLWAQWGLRAPIYADPDLWRCHECHECTRRCPRGARPGDVMAALRRECISHYSLFPGLGAWSNRPASLLLMLLGASGLLVVVLQIWQALGWTDAELAARHGHLVFPFWVRLPHGLLVALFSLVVLLDVVVLGIGVRRFSRDLRSRVATGPLPPETGSASAPTTSSVLARILWHEDFGLCRSPVRGLAHLLIVYGMLALVLTSAWVVTARINPLLGGLVYPLGWLSPWKVLANAGGLAALAGCLVMAWSRLRQRDGAGPGTAADWSLLGQLLLVIVTGFASEALHLARVEPLRWVVYVGHLASVLVLLFLLPHGKLAHAVYRTVALAVTAPSKHHPAQRVDESTTAAHVVAAVAQGGGPSR